MKLVSARVCAHVPCLAPVPYLLLYLTSFEARRERPDILAAATSATSTTTPSTSAHGDGGTGEGVRRWVGEKTCTGLYPAAGPEGSSWCRSRSRSGRSKTTMHQVHQVEQVWAAAAPTDTPTAPRRQNIITYIFWGPRNVKNTPSCWNRAPPGGPLFSWILALSEE